MYPTQQRDLINELVQNKDYYTVQKSIEKEEGIIQWQWLLFLIVGLLAIEWLKMELIQKLIFII